MVFDAAISALRQLFSQEFRSVFFKTLGLTILALIALWFGLKEVFDWFALPYIDALLPSGQGWAGWFSLVAALLAGLGIAVGLAFLIAPVTALIASLFLDDIAETVERESYPQEPAGQALPTIRGAILSVKFFGIVVLGNILALLLLLIPGVNIVAFFVVNGYLLGREYFEFAAMRFRSEDDAKALRRKNGGQVFLGGLVIAAFLAVPILNLLTPLFAAAMMVHLHKSASRRV